MTTYFLSYARSDATRALRIADALIAAGVSVWVDQYDIRPSQHWDRAVETAVRGCRGMIVILSPRSAASPNVADEVSVALQDGKDIIPILIEPCALPLRMTRMQYIDAVNDHEGAIRRCLTAIGEQGPGVAAAAAEPRAAVPSLPSQILRDAERRLTGYIGPIAAVLVQRATSRATSQAELYQTLSESIADGAERASFLGWVAEPGPPAAIAPTTASPGPISGQQIAGITRALTPHLGPVAAELVRRERAGAASAEELRHKLAARIAGEKDRAAFLRETRAI